MVIKGDIVCPNEIPDDSWLNNPEYAWFRQAYGYACTQSDSIWGLSKIEPEELYYVMTSFFRELDIDLEEIKEKFKK